MLLMDCFTDLKVNSLYWQNYGFHGDVKQFETLRPKREVIKRKQTLSEIQSIFKGIKGAKIRKNIKGK